MFNNFMDYEYQPYHRIFTHEHSNHGIYLGDVSAALDMHFIKNQPINVGKISSYVSQLLRQPREWIMWRILKVSSNMWSTHLLMRNRRIYHNFFRIFTNLYKNKSIQGTFWSIVRLEFPEYFIFYHLVCLSCNCVHHEEE